MYLLKGYMPHKDQKSKYIDPKTIILFEDRPLILIPYYQVNFLHFLSEESPKQGASELYSITAATYNPSVSIIAF